MADILEIGVPEGQTHLEVSVEDVLRGALGVNLQECTIVGRDAHGELFLASSIGSTFETYYWLDYAKNKLREWSE